MEQRDERPAREISRLIVGGALRVVVRRGVTPSLVVVAYGREAVASVKTTYEGETLTIERTGIAVGGGRGGNVYASNGGIVMGSVNMVFNGPVGSVTVTDGDIRNNSRSASTSSGGVSVAAGQVTVELVLPELAMVDVPSVGIVKLSDLAQRELRVDVSGAGTVSGSGTVESLRVSLSGAGSIALNDLTAERVEIGMSGAGSVAATATTSAEVNVSGVGSVHVYGNPPQRREHMSGFGRISYP